MSETLHPQPELTGIAALDESNDQMWTAEEEERNAIELPPLTDAQQQYLQSIQDPDVQADIGGESAESVELTTGEDDDYLPYLKDVEERWDLREQAYQDKTNGVQREPGDVSNEYVLPNRVTVHGIDISNGARIFNRDTGNPHSEELITRAVEKLRGATFNVNEGYNTAQGMEAISEVAEGNILADKEYADYERDIHLAGVPPEQAQLGWELANERVLAKEIERSLAQELQESRQFEAPTPPEFHKEDLPSIEGWRDSAARFYEFEEGRPFDGSDEDLIDWFVGEMSSLNWKVGLPTDNPDVNLGGMAYYMARAWSQDPEYAQALLTLVDIYDRMSTDMEIIGQNIGNIVTDPATWITVPGIGALGNRAGAVIAKNAMMRGLKARLTQGAVAGASVGSVEGAIHTAGADAMLQQMEQEAGTRKDIDYARMAMYGAAGYYGGGIVGAFAGPAVPFAVEGAVKAGRQMRKNMRQSHGPLRRQIGAINPEAVTPFRTHVTEHPEVEDAASLDAAFQLATDERFPNNRALKAEIQKRVKAAAAKEGINLEEDTPETRNFLKRMVVKDALRALQSNSNAVGWYDRTVSEALDVLSMIHPEIETNPDAKFAFTYILAVTSNGLKVNKNFELAEAVYQHYKQHGRMPTNRGIGTAAPAINKSLKAFNDWTDELGVDTLRKIMEEKFTAGQLNKADFKVTGEHQGTQVRGAAILGPKIGNGFFSNLNGHFDELTMDRWLMRTWGRLTGTLITERPDLVRQKKSSLKDLADQLRQDKEVVKEWKKIGVNLNERNMGKLAAAINKASTLPANRKVMNESGIKVSRPKNKKGDLEKATLGDFIRRVGNGLHKDIDGQKESPTVNDRNMIRGVFRPALEVLRDMGYDDMTMADLQALLWYPEKRLYDKAKSAEDVAEGYADDEAPDYANAAAELARSLGFSNEDIAKRVDDGRAARTRSSDGDIGPEGDQEEGRGLTPGERRGFLRERLYRPGRARASRNGQVRLYQGGGAGGDRESGNVVEVFEPSKAYQKLAGESEIPAPTVHEITPESAPDFHKAIQASKDNSPHGAAVYVYSPEEYANMRLFQTPDGNSGFAIKPDGDIVSVYSSGGGNALGMLQLAVEQGGTHLDAFDTALPDIYRLAGFEEYGRDTWNQDYMPEDWDKGVFKRWNNGEPDIVYMVAPGKEPPTGD